MKKIILLLVIFMTTLAAGSLWIMSAAPAQVLALAATCVDNSPAPNHDTAQCDPSLTATDSQACPGGTFLGFPKWYKYLSSQRYVDQLTGTVSCVPQLDGINSIWKIVAAVIELLLRLASLVAIGFVVFGGISYTISQGNPDKTKQALKTIINSLIGLVIAIIATALVSFIAGRFK